MQGRGHLLAARTEQLEGVLVGCGEGGNCNGQPEALLLVVLNCSCRRPKLTASWVMNGATEAEEVENGGSDEQEVAELGALTVCCWRKGVSGVFTGRATCLTTSKWHPLLYTHPSYHAGRR